MVEQLREGWTYVSNFVPIRTILLMFALLSLMGWPFMVLMPIFAGQVLGGGPHTLGFLMGAVGVGSLVSALSLVLRRSVRGLTKMIPVAATAFGAGLIAFGLSTRLWLSLLLMLVTGFGMMQGLTASNTIIQTLVDEKMRRPGDELLHDGVRGYGAFRQPACRRAGARHWSSAYGDRERRRVHCWRHLVLVATARDPQRHAADL